MQYDEVSPPVFPFSADDDQPPPIPLFHFEDEPSLSPGEPVIAQYSVIMREHMRLHVPHCNTVAEGNDSTQSGFMREATKVIKKLSSLNVWYCYCSRVEKTFLYSRLKILLMFFQL